MILGKLLLEKEDLEIKLSNLEGFIRSDADFYLLHEESHRLLLEQREIMLKYIRILDQRIKLIRKDQGK